jgi:hypothetical protein
VRPFVDFKVTVRLRPPSSQIDDVIAAKRDELKRIQPEITEIIVKADIQDLGSKVGAGYVVNLTGTIFFKSGRKPNLAQVERAGQQCFDYDFRVLPFFVLDTTSKTATSAPILCRKCRTRIGEVSNYLRLAGGGPSGEAQLRKQVSEAGVAHVRDAHPEIDPTSVVF